MLITNTSMVFGRGPYFQRHRFFTAGHLENYLRAPSRIANQYPTFEDLFLAWIATRSTNQLEKTVSGHQVFTTSINSSPPIEVDRLFKRLFHLIFLVALPSCLCLKTIFRSEKIAQRPPAESILWELLAWARCLHHYFPTSHHAAYY